ncbi:MAG: sigma-70 family RNA polymerase sigma factor [Myxococcota bacterium]|nr:sigma-70 family RNA polymerase sigma factor [Myxococcota bacterium]MDW8361570.1 sigma-70 family RNA polymerase sigma factor [Myxococcales bacterium]
MGNEARRGHSPDVLVAASDAEPSAEPVAVAQRVPLASTGDLVRQHGGFVWRVLRQLGVSEADCDDATQEVFLVVHRRRDSFDGSSSVRTWLYGIALRIARTARRTGARRREQLQPPEAFVESQATDDPERWAERAGERRLLHRVLAELDEAHRMTFVLHDVEQMPAVEVARALGCPVKTVYSRLYAARARLAAAVRAAVGEATDD